MFINICEYFTSLVFVIRAYSIYDCSITGSQTRFGYDLWKRKVLRCRQKIDSNRDDVISSGRDTGASNQGKMKNSINSTSSKTDGNWSTALYILTRNRSTIPHLSLISKVSLPTILLFHNDHYDNGNHWRPVTRVLIIINNVHKLDARSIASICSIHISLFSATVIPRRLTKHSLTSSVHLFPSSSICPMSTTQTNKLKQDMSVPMASLQLRDFNMLICSSAQ